MATPELPSPQPKGSPLPLLFGLAVVLVVAAFQLLPELGRIDFHREESRRVLPAREMMSSGNWIVPTLWSVPYLSKPPGIYWALACIFELSGGISEVTARLLSVCATTLTALGLCLLGRRLYGLRAGVYGALLFLIATETQAKGRLAEIEASLTLAILVAVSAWWFARDGRATLWGVAGLGLGVAILLKGPAALLYFLSGPVLLACARRAPREVLRPGLLAALLLGIGLPAVWAGLLFREMGYEVVLGHWSGQVAGQGGRTLGAYLSERGEYLIGTLLAFAPAAWILLASLGTVSGRAVWREQRLAFAFWTVVGGWLFFLVFPGTSVRYLTPAFPFVALVSGYLLHEATRGADGPLQQRLHTVARGLAGLAVLVACAITLAFFVPLGDIQANALGLFLAALLAALGLFIWRVNDERRLPTALLLVPLVLGQVLITQVGPSKAVRHARKHHALAMDAALPPGEILQVVNWSNFSTLMYLQHEVHFEDDLERLPPGSWALMDPASWAEVETARPGSRLVRDFQLRRNPRLLVHLGRGWGE